jgi:hypothetical protein
MPYLTPNAKYGSFDIGAFQSVPRCFHCKALNLFGFFPYVVHGTVLDYEYWHKYQLQ